MICKNCSAEFDSSFDVCPNCGETAPKKFVVSIPDSDAEEDGFEKETENTENAVNAVQDGFADSEDYVSEAYTDSVDTYEPEDCAESDSVQQENYGNTEAAQDGFEAEEAENAAHEETEENDTAEAEETAQVKTEENTLPSDIQIKAVKRRRPASQPVVEAVTKKEKKTGIAIMVIMSVIGVLAIVLSFVKINTDILDANKEEQKAVATVSISEQEEKELEAFISNCYQVISGDFNIAEADSESFIMKINPQAKGSIYSRLFNETLQTETAADPLNRFADEEGKYAYCKAEKAKIDKILSAFGVESYGEANCKDCYYSDGYYYFTVGENNGYPLYSADITKSKMVLDGSWYVECEFAGGEAAAEKYYMLVEKNSTTKDEEAPYVINKISTEPLFDAIGNQVKSENEPAYTIERQVIEGKTNDGRIYCRYVIEYPVFDSKNQEYHSVNKFFEDSVSVYRLKADGAQKAYDEFKAQGGKDSALPLTEIIIARVTFEDENHLSVVEKITGSKVNVVQPEPETTSQPSEENYYDDYYGYYDEETTTEVTTTQPPAPVVEVVCERRVEAYTFDKTTGDFVSKDSLVGKDYMLASEILYRIYNSYDYSSVIPEIKEEEAQTTDFASEDLGEETTAAAEEEYYDEYYDEYYEQPEEEYYYDDTPEDTEGLGTRIYESACALTKEGLTFYFIGDKGYIETVTLPTDILTRLREQ